MDTKQKESRNIYMYITFGALLLAIVFNLDSVFSFLSYLWHLLMPFIIGFSIAFILTILTKYLEKTLLKNIKSHQKVISFFTTIIIFIIFIILICFIVGPELINSTKQLTKQIPQGYDQLMILLENNKHIFNNTFEPIINYILELNIDLTSLSSSLMSNWQSIFNSGYSIISNTFSALYTFFIGLIFSIYLIFYRETLYKQLRFTSKTLLGDKKTDYIESISKLASDTFSNFITCQCLEACILGTMFFVSMTIFHMPYALLLGVLIAITALIPVFGAFIGCFVGIILIGLINPIQALWFLILFLVLQQIEGNLIYPHVVGNSVGLPSIWVFVAVIIGGNVMGILGMFVFIPLTSILYALFKSYVYKVHNEKKASA